MVTEGGLAGEHAVIRHGQLSSQQDNHRSLIEG